MTPRGKRSGYLRIEFMSNSADTSGSQRVQVIELFRMVQVEHFRHFAVDSFNIYRMAGLRGGLGGVRRRRRRCQRRAMSVAMLITLLLRKKRQEIGEAELKVEDDAFGGEVSLAFTTLN